MQTEQDTHVAINRQKTKHAEDSTCVVFEFEISFKNKLKLLFSKSNTITGTSEYLQDKPEDISKITVQDITQGRKDVFFKFNEDIVLTQKPRKRKFFRFA